MLLGICATLILLAGCASKGADLSLRGASARPWTPFYQREFPEGRLDYFYDPLRVQRRAGHVIAHWKVLSSAGTTTLYGIDISCWDARFTEKGTVIFDTQGRAKKMPKSELYVDRPIENGTSSDVFRRMFCG